MPMNHLFSRFAAACLLCLSLCLIATAGAQAAPPSPSEFLGIPVGADRTLADWRQIVSYFRALDAASDRVRVETLGKSTLGEEIIVAVISSEENLRDLPRIRETARRLADPRGLSPDQVAALARDGRAVALVTCAIHASEIASTQMAMEWAHALATAKDAETTRRLSNVVLLLVPSLNPDGQMMETKWYREHLGTPYEGSRMPWLYHHYVGHDNNRDWFMLTQAETKVVTKAVYRDWFPQVWLDEHQMGQTGPRIFMPPYAEPVDPDIHPLVWREVNLIGSNMALRLEQAGKSGAIYGYAFDAYWIGGTKNTAWWKNISGLLTEVASVRLASPVFVEPTELTGGGRKGLVEYGTQTNFPNPWKGGWWRLRDIMDYERIVSDALLETVADRREDVLKNMAARAMAAVTAFPPTEGYRIPAVQRDGPSALALARLLVGHGVDVMSAPGGDIWVPLAQPYGKFVAEMLTPQRYPEVRLVPGKEIVWPYDVAAWTLPMMLGVEVGRGTMPAGLGKFDASPKPATALERGAAWAVDGGSPEAARVVQAALKAGGRVGRVPVGAGAAGLLAPGSFVLDAKGAEAAREKAAAAGVLLVPLATAPPTGDVPLLKKPRVGLYRPFTASTDEGWTRFVLEDYGFDPKPLDNRDVKAGGLKASFDVIVLPDISKDVLSGGHARRDEGERSYLPEPPPEYRGGIEKEGTAVLKKFVEEGGTLVALASSTDWVLSEFNLPVRNVLSKVKREDFLCPGSLLRANVAGWSPYTLGLPAEVPLFVDEGIAFQTTVPGAELKRWVLASYPADARDLLMSGFLHGGERLARRAAAVATTFGKGRIVLLGFRVQQRAQTHVTYPFLFNALWASAAPPSAGPKP